MDAFRVLLYKMSLMRWDNLIKWYTSRSIQSANHNLHGRRTGRRTQSTHRLVHRLGITEPNTWRIEGWSNNDLPLGSCVSQCLMGSNWQFVSQSGKATYLVYPPRPRYIFPGPQGSSRFNTNTTNSPLMGKGTNFNPVQCDQVGECCCSRKGYPIKVKMGLPWRFVVGLARV